MSHIQRLSSHASSKLRRLLSALAPATLYLPRPWGRRHPLSPLNAPFLPQKGHSKRLYDPFLSHYSFGFSTLPWSDQTDPFTGT